MRIELDAGGTVEGLKTLVESAGRHGKAGCGLMLLACDANGFTPEGVDAVLSKADLPVFGGVFPAVIHQDRLLERGTVAVVLPVVSDSRYLPESEEAGGRMDDRIEAAAGDLSAAKTMAVFVDGTARRIGAFIEGLFNVFGLELNYVGGGAGSLDMRRKPCLFTNGGLRAGGAVIASLPCGSGVGVCHGWEPLGSPFQVTEARDNVIRTLDWRPALDVYAEAVAAHGGKRPDAGNFQEAARAWPFGISRLGTEQIVRDPMRVGEGGALQCAGEVPEGSFLHLMHGDERSLIEAAGTALSRARAARPSWGRGDLHVLMDCISRVLFLGGRFREELAAVRRDGVPLVGACSIGEIANSGAEYLEFYNKTSVVAILDAQ